MERIFEDNVDRLLATLAKDVFTTEFVDVTDAFNWAKLVPRLRKDAFTAELKAVFPCVAVSVKDVFTV